MSGNDMHRYFLNYFFHKEPVKLQRLNRTGIHSSNVDRLVKDLRVTVRTCQFFRTQLPRFIISELTDTLCACSGVDMDF